MRGTIEDAPSAHPLAASLPAVYLGDDLAQRLCAALDVVLAPVLLTLDSLPAYLDPDTAPEDMLDWLAGWVALPALRGADTGQQRTQIQAASELHAARGTLAALQRALALTLGEHVVESVEEGGGATWSRTPGGELPGAGSDVVVVRLAAGTGPVVGDLAEAVVALFVPAHVRYRIQITQG